MAANYANIHRVGIEFQEKNILNLHNIVVKHDLLNIGVKNKQKLKRKLLYYQHCIG